MLEDIWQRLPGMKNGSRLRFNLWHSLFRVCVCALFFIVASLLASLVLKFKSGRRCGVAVGKYLSLVRRRLEITLSTVSLVNPSGVGDYPALGYYTVKCRISLGLKLLYQRFLWYHDCFVTWRSEIDRQERAFRSGPLVHLYASFARILLLSGCS
jgi:hypothetical protein